MVNVLHVKIKTNMVGIVLLKQNVINVMTSFVTIVKLSLMIVLIVSSVMEEGQQVKLRENVIYVDNLLVLNTIRILMMLLNVYVLNV